MSAKNRRSARISARASTQKSQSSRTPAAKRQRAESSNRGSNASKHLSAPSTGNLPIELLEPIFKDAADYDPPFTAFRISQVCRLWRKYALNIPSLWSNVLRLSALHTRGDPTSVKALLDLCAERSAGLTHVDVSTTLSAKSLLSIINKHPQTLVDLRIGTQPICRCPRELAPGTHAWHRPAPLDCVGRTCDTRAPGLSFDNIYRFISSLSPASNLNHLSVEVISQNCRAWRRSSLDFAERPLPRLQSLTMVFHGYERDKAIHELLGWLNRMLPEVQHFSCSINSQCGMARSWARSVIRAKAHRLRSLRMYLPSWDCPLPGTVELPLLETLILGYSRKDESDFSSLPFGPCLMRTPGLRKLRTLASLTTSVESPNVTCASLVVSNWEDLTALRGALASWGQLETLTIQLEVDSPRRAKRPCSENSKTLRIILQILGEIDASTNTVRAPKLRHLGIVFRLDPAVEEDIAWAAMPWTADEEQHQYRELLPRYKGNGYRNATLDASLDTVMAQRRRLSVLGSQARSTEPGSSRRLPAADEETVCVPLERIKLGGLRVSHKLWATLKSNSKARLLCYPEPTPPEDHDEAEPSRPQGSKARRSRR